MLAALYLLQSVLSIPVVILRADVKLTLAVPQRVPPTTETPMICIKYPSYGRESYRITKHWVLSPELEAYVLGETDSIPGNTGLGWVILAKTAREMLRDGRLKTGWQGRHLYYPEAPNPPDPLLAYRDRSWWTRLKENLGW